MFKVKVKVKVKLEEYFSVMDTATKLKQAIISQKVNKWLICGGVLGGLIIYRWIKHIISIKYYKSPPIYTYNVPIVGSLFMFLLYPKQFRCDILPQYGDIVGYNIANIKFYKLNDVLLIHKLFKLATQRPAILANTYLFAGITPDVGLCNEDGRWSYRRKLLMQSLITTLNSRKVEMEMNKILKEITYEYLDSNLSKTTFNNNDKQFLWYPRRCLRNISFNVIYYSIFNKYYKLNDLKFEQYSDESDIFISNAFNAVFASNLKPKFLSKLLLENKVKAFHEAAMKVQQLVMQDYQDAVNDGNTAGERICEYYHKDSVMTNDMAMTDLRALIQAGMDTTAHTMEVGLLLLAKYPNVQNIVYNELTSNDNNNINSIDKKERAGFDLSKVKEFPQLRAFVWEVLRVAAPDPDGVQRSCDKEIRVVRYKNRIGSGGDDIICDYRDSKLWGSAKVLKILKENEIEYDYILEKNRILEPNITYLHWKSIENGEELNLNYWLKKNSDESNDKKFTFVTNKSSIPFGAGKRDCPGQSLAIKELYAFFGNLLLKYQILSPSENDIKLEYTWNSVVFSVKPEMGVVVKYRQN